MHKKAKIAIGCHLLAPPRSASVAGVTLLKNSASSDKKNNILQSIL
jgi:hypothetical protein